MSRPHLPAASSKKFQLSPHIRNRIYEQIYQHDCGCFSEGEGIGNGGEGGEIE